MTPSRLSCQVFSDEALAQIEETALRLLDEVGIVIQHAGARERLHSLGCRIAGERAYVPRTVVEWTLKNVSRWDTFFSADGQRSVKLGEGAIRFHNAGGPPFIHDLESGQRRLGRLQDLADASRLMDALPNVDVVIPLLGAQDVPAEIMTVASADVMLRNTSKPVSAAAAEKPADVRYLVAQAMACCGGEAAFRRQPTTAIMVSPVSPLTFTEQVIDTMIAVAESGAGFQPLPAPSLGATGAITMPAVLAQQHVEVLGSYLIVAAYRPGTPVMYCSRVNPIDLRSAVSTWGNPEVGMTAAGATQLAHRLGLTCDAYGLCSTSARLDPQLAYERLANAMVPALAGVDLMSGVGVLENNMAVSLDVAVLDDEIISLMKRIIRGCEVTPDTLAFDVMREVILGDGVFLGHPYTAKQMRQGAVWMPGISERTVNSSEDPLAGVNARAHQRVLELLRSHQVAPLPATTVSQLDEIMIEARRELLPA